MKECPKCHGTGKVRDDAELGKQMQDKRKAAGFTLKHVAEGMGVSIGYLCDLEHGRRLWSAKLQESFINATQGRKL
jgi:hypothetical protein